MIDEIAAATQQQSTTTNQIATSVDSISGVADEVSTSSSDLANMAENMAQQAETLNGLIEHFTVEGSNANSAGDGRATTGAPPEVTTAGANGTQTNAA